VPPSPPEPRPRARRDRVGWSAASVLTAIAIAVPVLLLVSSVLQPQTDMWSQQWRTRLPGEIWSTAQLLIGVAVCSTVLGVGLAWLVSAYRFPGSRVFGWLLILPLAMPSYILGYLTIATVGRTGPIQDQWRAWFGRDAWFPDVESLGGAILTFTLVLYPYVYLLARAALRDQAAGAYLTARSLGAGPAESMRRVVLPLVRPAIAAGAAVVMMETLTDFATVQYFGVDTVSVGVFRIWRGTYDRDAAAELALVVLAFAVLAIGLERVGRGRAKYGQSGGADSGMVAARLTGARAAAAVVACAGVVFLAFVGPTMQLIVWAIAEQRSPRGTPLLEQFPEYLWNSLQLVAVTAIVCLVLATLLANGRRFGRPTMTKLATRTTALGYAVPGPVIGMGVLLTVVAIDTGLEGIGLNLPGAVATGSMLVLLYAYAVRFLTPGLAAIESGTEQVSDDMTATARSLGAGPSRTVRRVHLPLSKTALLSAGILVGVDALKELPIVLLLRPFGFDTLPVWVYNLVSESRFQQAALPALSIILVATVPVILVARGLDRSSPRPTSPASDSADVVRELVR
jgi:iron(III) transport system permease protein